ncbi:MAG TPA: pirin family protein, partial [Polyangiaceae bacterium]|nr:pirin family protein [Polyangiaceae bacterium]
MWVQTTQNHPISSASALSRPIEGIYKAPPLHWVGDGFRVAGYFSSIPDALRKLDPFLLLDYHPAHTYSPTDRPRGVGVHPHRGFETVTIAFQGSVAHHDSTGAGGVIGPGDVQWMTAASGILHKEYHEAGWAAQGGPFQMAQLWVNLPKAHKMDPPQYQPIVANQMGVVSLPENAGEIRVIAGETFGVKGPAKTHTPISLLDVRLHAKGHLALPFPSSYNVGMLVMQGEARLGETHTIVQHDFVVFEHSDDPIRIEAASDTQLLMLAGEPIREPVVSYGPFVMNTEREIQQAFADFRSG